MIAPTTPWGIRVLIRWPGEWFHPPRWGNAPNKKENGAEIEENSANVSGVSQNFVREKSGKSSEGRNTRTSQKVTHPSTTLAQAHLTAEFGWDAVH